jgi:hypothetical protein
VNPTTSQNSTEHTRRSAAGSRADVAAAAGAASETGAPHLRQKRFPGVSVSPHVGQPRAGAPQSPQKRSSSASDAPHCPHLTRLSLRSARQPRQAHT